MAQLGIEAIAVGAFARDLHFHYRAGVEIQRGTEDVDIALSVSSWEEFGRLLQVLIESKTFSKTTGRDHRLTHRRDRYLDLIPFGGVENSDRQIAWPPEGDTVMQVFGFKEALASAEQVLLPTGVQIQVASVPALALLKLTAWEERNLLAPRKDAADLMLIIEHYLDIGTNRARLLGDFSEWTEEEGFDVVEGGARLLGMEIRALLTAEDHRRAARILEQQTDSATDARLAREMYSLDPDRSIRLLRNLLRGLNED